MSGWINLTRGLYAIGGGPAKFSEFSDTAENVRPAQALRNAQRVGTIRMLRRSSPRMYELTPAGEGLCEGTYRVGRQLGSKRIAIVPVIKDSVSDDLIERLLIESRRELGETASVCDVLRTYSIKLAQVARHEALTT